MAGCANLGMSAYAKETKPRAAAAANGLVRTAPLTQPNDVISFGMAVDWYWHGLTFLVSKETASKKKLEVRSIN